MGPQHHRGFAADFWHARGRLIRRGVRSSSPTGRLPVPFAPTDPRRAGNPSRDCCSAGVWDHESARNRKAAVSLGLCLNVAAALQPRHADARASVHAGMRALSLLDGFQVRTRGRVVRVPMSSQRLLAFLALHARPLQRLFVAGSLWLAASEDHANASLRTTLWRLRRLDRGLVQATPTHVALVPDVAIDLRDTSAAARRAISGNLQEGDVSMLCNTEELLPDWYDDWVVIERERFRQLRLHALDALCDRFTGSGRYADAANAALCAITIEPLRESAHRALIRTHLAEGNHGEAIRHYELYCSLLERRLGLDPSPKLRELVWEHGGRASFRRPAPVPPA